MKKILIILCLIFAYTTASAQLSGQAKIDSLLSELPNSEQDTNKVNLLNDLSFTYYSINPDKGIEYGKKGLELAKKLKWKKGVGKCYNSIGINYFFGKSDFPNALHFYYKALEINEEIGNKRGIAYNLGNIGIIYSNQSDYTKALGYYLKALEINEEIGDKRGIANTLGNIGIIYLYQSDYTKALEYYFKAIEINKEIGNKRSIATNLGNIGNIYSEQSDYPKALEYYFKAIEINEEIGIKRGIATNLGNIGIIYKSQSDYPKALEYYFKALEINEEIGNKRGIAINLGNMGLMYLNLSKDSILNKVETTTALVSLNKNINLNNSIKYSTQAVEILDSIGELYARSEFLKKLSDAYKQKGDYKNSDKYLREYIVIKDSVFNEEKAKELGYMTAERDRIIKDRELEEEARKKAKEIAYRNNTQYLSISIFIILLGILMMLSGKIQMSEWVARGLVFITFILLFEFILVVIDPITDDYSEGEPFIKLGINLCIAFVLYPIHQFFNRKVSRIIVKRGGGTAVEKIIKEFNEKKNA